MYMCCATKLYTHYKVYIRLYILKDEKTYISFLYLTAVSFIIIFLPQLGDPEDDCFKQEQYSH